MVQAKFVFNKYTTYAYDKWENGVREKVEARDLVFSPVNKTNNPDDENSRFFASTPSGEIVIRTVNPEAWKQFELNKEYYVDFTPADPNIASS